MKEASNLFRLNPDVHYLNCAYMSPLLQSVENAGSQEMMRRRNPQEFALEDFFAPVAELKALFSKIINCNDTERIAIIPSASYGIANAARNIPVKKGGKILILEGQFPSNYYIWKRISDENGMNIEVVSKPKNEETWSESLIRRIDSETAAVAIAPVHWADGTAFDCESIGRVCRDNGVYFILDGTQAIGAVEFDIEMIQADALICAGYKWLMGPYGFGLAYYGSNYDNGKAFEENWFAKTQSDEFAGLVDYKEEFRPKAWRFNVGESSNFIYVKMMIAALKQILDWNPNKIQEHCGTISKDFIQYILANGFKVNSDKEKLNHLFGILPPDNFSFDKFTLKAKNEGVYVSQRGPYIRISPHLYNNVNDFLALKHCLTQSLD